MNLGAWAVALLTALAAGLGPCLEPLLILEDLLVYNGQENGQEAQHQHQTEDGAAADQVAHITNGRDTGYKVEGIAHQRQYTARG